MKIAAALVADLGMLTAAIFDPAAADTADIADTVQAFAANARLAVRSLLGLSITITEHTDTASDRVILQLTVLDDQAAANDILTSLRLPIPTDPADPDQRRIQIVLYADTPGAFVDMAADLAFLTGHAYDPVDLDQHRMLAHEPDITGVLQAESVINQAIGVLIARGHTREQAHTELHTLAHTARTDPVTEATRIMSALTPGEPGFSAT